jgi:hypothetical protein
MNLEMEVSREITRRAAVPWFRAMGWDISPLSAQRQVALQDLRAFLLLAREEVFAPSAPEARSGQLERWMFSLRESFRQPAHSDAAHAIAATVQQYDVPRSFLYDALTAVESNLRHEVLMSPNDVLRLAYRQTGTFTLSAAVVLGSYQPKNRDYFMTLGIAAGMVDLLYSWTHWERSNWFPVPRVWLQEGRPGWKRTLLPLWQVIRTGGEDADAMPDSRRRLELTGQPSGLSPARRLKIWRQLATLGLETLTQVDVPDHLRDGDYGTVIQAWHSATHQRLIQAVEDPETLVIES